MRMFKNALSVWRVPSGLPWGQQFFRWILVRCFFTPNQRGSFDIVPMTLTTGMIKTAVILEKKYGYPTMNMNMSNKYPTKNIENNNTMVYGIFCTKRKNHKTYVPWYSHDISLTLLTMYMFMIFHDIQRLYGIPSGKRLHSYGKSPCSMAKSTISMGHFQ